MVYVHITNAKMRKNTNLHPDGRKPASGLRFSQSSYSRVTVLAIPNTVHLVVPQALIPARLTGKSHSRGGLDIQYSGLVSWGNLLDLWGCQEGNHSVSRD